MKAHTKDSSKGELDITGMHGKGVARSKRVYTPPKIVSAEPLEATAATCDPPTVGGPGKTVGLGSCAILGS